MTTSRTEEQVAGITPRKLWSIWLSLTTQEREKFREYNPEATAFVDPIWWMRRWTKTLDEQDKENPYKPLPDWPYFEAVYQLWQDEQLIYIEKSRTMMMSWFIAGLCFHQIANFQPGRAVFWSDTEKHSKVLVEYCWTLWEQSAPFLQNAWRLLRPRKQQSEVEMELRDGGKFIALPGKEPDTIRSNHPSIVVIDEASLVENFGEALDVALSTKVPKIVCIATAAPSRFREITKKAKAVSWPGSGGVTIERKFR